MEGTLFNITGPVYDVKLVGQTSVDGSPELKLLGRFNSFFNLFTTTKNEKTVIYKVEGAFGSRLTREDGKTFHTIYKDVRTLRGRKQLEADCDTLDSSIEDTYNLFTIMSCRMGFENRVYIYRDSVNPVSMISSFGYYIPEDEVDEVRIFFKGTKLLLSEFNKESSTLRIKTLVSTPL